MNDQDHLLGEPAVPQLGEGAGPVPEQRVPLPVPHRSAAGQLPPVTERRAGGPRLRVDARRNLESVLRAAREVFGELGYDAPMEEVARRAGVGVGTVYRRFPSKEVLVQRIAAEEVAWLTARAREALYGPARPWDALAGYLATAVGTGAGRLLPPEAFDYAEELARVPEQRLPPAADWAAASCSSRPARAGCRTPTRSCCSSYWPHWWPGRRPPVNCGPGSRSRRSCWC